MEFDQIIQLLVRGFFTGAINGLRTLSKPVPFGH